MNYERLVEQTRRNDSEVRLAPYPTRLGHPVGPWRGGVVLRIRSRIQRGLEFIRTAAGKGSLRSSDERHLVFPFNAVIPYFSGNK